MPTLCRRSVNSMQNPRTRSLALGYTNTSNPRRTRCSLHIEKGMILPDAVQSADEQISEEEGGEDEGGGIAAMMHANRPLDSTEHHAERQEFNSPGSSGQGRQSHGTHESAGGDRA
jgi:hypothetical protein